MQSAESFMDMLTVPPAPDMSMRLSKSPLGGKDTYGVLAEVRSALSLDLCSSWSMGDSHGNAAAEAELETLWSPPISPPADHIALNSPAQPAGMESMNLDSAKSHLLTMERRLSQPVSPPEQPAESKTDATSSSADATGLDAAMANAASPMQPAQPPIAGEIPATLPVDTSDGAEKVGRPKKQPKEGAKPKRAPRGDPKLRMPIKNSSANGAKRNSELWSKDEDDLLRTKVAEHGGANWKVRASYSCTSTHS